MPERYEYAIFEKEKANYREIISLTGKYESNQPRRYDRNNAAALRLQGFSKIETVVSLYQSILDPWRFVLRVDLGPSFKYFESRHDFFDFGGIFEEGSGFGIDYSHFYAYLQFKLPMSLKYMGKNIKENCALRSTG